MDPGITAAESLAAHKRNLRGALIFAVWTVPSLLRLGLGWALVFLLLAVLLALMLWRAK